MWRMSPAEGGLRRSVAGVESRLVTDNNSPQTVTLTRYGWDMADLYDDEGETRPTPALQTQRGNPAQCGCDACRCPRATGLLVCPACQVGDHPGARSA